MASVFIEAILDAPEDAAWAVLRDVGSADKAFPGVLTASSLADGVRTVTFASGNVVKERIVALDDERKRLAYSVIEGRFTHHSASMRILADGPGRCRFQWTSDFLPDDFAPLVRSLMEQGAAAFKRAVETAAGRA